MLPHELTAVEKTAELRVSCENAAVDATDRSKKSAQLTAVSPPLEI